MSLSVDLVEVEGRNVQAISTVHCLGVVSLDVLGCWEGIVVDVEEIDRGLVDLQVDYHVDSLPFVMVFSSIRGHHLLPIDVRNKLYRQGAV